MDLSIGQMARINHISIQTLRLYDKMGLLKAGSSRCRLRIQVLQYPAVCQAGSDRQPEAVRP